MGDSPKRSNSDGIAEAVEAARAAVARASLDERLQKEKENAFEEIIINSPSVNLRDLRRLSWHGIPDKFRADAWQLLLGYVPTKASRRTEARRRKRNEYRKALEQHFFSGVDHSPSTASPEEDGGADDGSDDGDKGEGDSATELGSLKSELSYPSAVEATDEEEEDADDAASVSSSDSSEFSTASALLDYTSNTDLDPPTPTRFSSQVRRMSNPFSWKKDDDSNGHNNRGGIYRQIRLDVDRFAGRPVILSQRRIRIRLCRALFLWSVRHPACGYVQGMHDVAATLFIVFLSGYIGNSALLDEKFAGDHSSSKMSLHLDDVPDQLLDAVEADVYWCLTNIMWNIQDHYTADQPGLQRMVFLLEDLVSRLDPPLAHHLKKERIEFLWFAFRWMNCLLARDLNWRCLTRLWDTCLSEDGGGRASVSSADVTLGGMGAVTAATSGVGASKNRMQGVQVCVPSWDGFDYFHVYVCAALLHRFSKIMQSMEFEGLFHFLQNLPTKNWEVNEIEQLLSQAYAWRTTFRGYEERILSGKKEEPSTENNHVGSTSISYQPQQIKEKQMIQKGRQKPEQRKSFSSFLGKLNSSLKSLAEDNTQYSSDSEVCLDL